MTNAPLIWLTRPAADSASFAAELAEQHIQTIVAPVMHIVPQPLAALPAQPTAILLTSRHAARALASLPSAWRTLPVYCVGSSTASSVSEHGFTHIRSGAADVMTLLPLIAQDLGSGAKLLYLAGEDITVDVAHLLGAQSIKVTTQIVYRAVAEPSLDATVREALAAGTITGVAFFSPRSAEIACTLMQVANLADTAKHIDAFCFSLNVATAAGKLAWKHLHACHIPTRHAMRELIVSHAAKTL